MQDTLTGPHPGLTREQAPAWLAKTYAEQGIEPEGPVAFMLRALVEHQQMHILETCSNYARMIGQATPFVERARVAFDSGRSHPYPKGSLEALAVYAAFEVGLTERTMATRMIGLRHLIHMLRMPAAPRGD